jgi:hypothetical protein
MSFQDLGKFHIRRWCVQTNNLKLYLEEDGFLPRCFRKRQTKELVLPVDQILKNSDRLCLLYVRDRRDFIFMLNAFRLLEVLECMMLDVS